MKTAKTGKRAGIKFRDWLKEELKDAEFKAHYEMAAVEFKVAEEVAKARQAANMTQNELAKKIHTKQQAISRIEAGGANTTIEILERIAKALKATLEIRIVLAGHR